MKKIPYGESNYKEIVNNNMYYIDKTNYIEILEKMPRFQFFIRPRRFGKSLFLSMLETYYDVAEKENFEKYFGALYIGKNKTEEANKYLVLRLSFAGVVTDQGKEEIIKSIDQTVRSSVRVCFDRYSSFFDRVKFNLDNISAINIFKILKEKLNKNNQKIILLIDEYDNFANGLMIKDDHMYKELVQTDGYIKSFYKEIKEGTAEGVIARVFITGVSPILLDDLTSGANIFENLTNEYILNSMMGVTEKELEEIVAHYQLGDFVDRNDLMDMMKDLYNGYKFNSKNTETIYNTGMILYLTNKMNINKEYPDNMLDDNIKTDYGKIRVLAQIFESKDELRSIIEEDKLVGPIEIKSRFGIDKLYKGTEKDENFISLLYYLGLLTIKATSGKSVYLGIPNYSVKIMYWEYLYKTYEIGLTKKMSDIKLAVEKMRKDANVKEIMEIYKEVRKELSNRDLTFYNEMTSKAIFITLLFVDGIYMLESEKETRNGYSDLYLKEGVTYKEEVNFRYMLEFKHIKEGDYTKEKLEQKKKEATEQLKKYIDDYKIKEDGEKPLKKMILITIGKNDTFYQELN
ncbi:UNVERIFIED_CONTAM: PD-(D/E)XK nuclease superfamily protein [Acetivibrio alkalicellulosi]